MKPIARLRYLAASTLIALSLVAGQAFARPQPLQITVFVHQDVSASTDALYNTYLEHWEKAMNEISGREVIFEYITEANAITTLNYQHEDVTVPLREMSKLFGWHGKAHPKQGHGSLQKGLLLTQHPINDVAGGVAEDRGDVGIASLVSYNFPAHELGHMFGATHENATGGWSSLCDTYMMPQRNAFKAHCYAYSEANEDLLGNILIKLH